MSLNNNNSTAVIKSNDGGYNKAKYYSKTLKYKWQKKEKIRLILQSL